MSLPQALQLAQEAAEEQQQAHSPKIGHWINKALKELVPLHFLRTAGHTAGCSQELDLEPFAGRLEAVVHNPLVASAASLPSEEEPALASSSAAAIPASSAGTPVDTTHRTVGTAVPQFLHTLASDLA